MSKDANSVPTDEEANSVPESQESKTVPSFDMTFSLPDVSDTASDFIADDPEPEEITTDEYNQDEPADGETLTESKRNETDSSERARGLVSSGGDVFDPSIHAYPPKETKTGKYRRKRKSDIEKDQETANVAYQKEAQNLAFLYGDSHRLLFGDGGRVDSVNDLIPLRDALEAYMVENGLKEVPVGWRVLLTAASYSSSVGQREENKGKIQAIKEKLKGWGLKLFPFLKKRKATVTKIHNDKTRPQEKQQQTTNEEQGIERDYLKPDGGQPPPQGGIF